MRTETIAAELAKLRSAWAEREPQLYAAERKVEELQAELATAKEFFGGLLKKSDAERDEARAELARVTAALDEEIRSGRETDDLLTMRGREMDALHAELARVKAERDAERGNIEAYLQQKVCCNGDACGCGGITRLQEIVHEEAGATIDRLTAELAALRRDKEALEAACVACDLREAGTLPIRNAAMNGGAS